MSTRIKVGKRTLKIPREVATSADPDAVANYVASKTPKPKPKTDPKGGE